MASSNGVIEQLVGYVSRARTAELPPEVVRKTKHRILDTLAAMISGIQIKPGQMALEYAGLHPGCAILPAALGMAEREDASGADLVEAVVLGDDIGARTNKALGRDALRARNHLAFGIGGTLGAAAAAGCLAGLARAEQDRYLFSYAAQQARMLIETVRDLEQLPKARDLRPLLAIEARHVAGTRG